MDELQISGKRFISSRRLARDNGYTADYLGQLIRGGKIVGQKVGRAWYVEATSFDAFLGGEASVAPAVIPEEEVEVIKPVVVEKFEKAPEVEPKPEPAPVLIEPVVEQEVVEEIKEVLPEPVVVTKQEEPVHHVPLHIIKKAEPTAQTQEEVAVRGLQYFSDTEPSLPEIRSTAKESRVAQPRAIELQKETEVFVPAQKRASKIPMFALAGAGIAVFVFFALVSSAVSLNLSIEEGNAANVSYSLPW